MKNAIPFIFATVLGTAVFANTESFSESEFAYHKSYINARPFIFVENGITFSVYSDGEFDFYMDSQVNHRSGNITFNSGYNYNPYTQYDDYGAVIQVQNVPIYYDHYGRVSQIGNIDIRYRRNRVNRIGGMHVYYNRNGFYNRHSGFINAYNVSYVYRPFHAFFVRPSINFCLVNNRPYRRYYAPIRYTYYNPYRHNTRRTYAAIGRTHRYNQNRVERSNIYRNNGRVGVRRNIAKRSTTSRNLSANDARTNHRSRSPRAASKTTARNTKRVITRNSSTQSSARSVQTGRNRNSAARTSSPRATASRSSSSKRSTVARNRTSALKAASPRTTASRSSLSKSSSARRSTVAQNRSNTSRTASPRSSTPRSTSLRSSRRH